MLTSALLVVSDSHYYSILGVMKVMPTREHHAATLTCQN